MILDVPIYVHPGEPHPAVVDAYYELWRPPPGFQKLRVPGMKGVRDDPSFAFYSRWAALTYRHVLTA